MTTDTKQLSQKAWACIKRNQPDLALQLLYQPMQTAGEENPDLMALYGYCLCIVQRKRKEGVQLCKRAIQLNNTNPQYYYLLGMVYLDADTKKLAFDTFQKGLKVNPKYQPIQAVLKKMGIRKKPVIPFLPRENPINVKLGKMRHEQITKQK